MGKTRSCRRTVVEDKIHDKAVKMRKMTDEQLEAAGIPAGLVRMSCGLEDKEDLIADLAQSLDAI